MLVYIALFIWYLAVVSVSLYGAYGIYKRTTFAVSLGRSTLCEGVTILRPLKGIDTEMYQCLKSAFIQKVRFELIFCIADPLDPAITVAQRLIDEFPAVDAKIMIGAESFGPNPKINNLVKGYRAAKYDLLWVLDSNVWVSPLTMAQAVQALENNPKLQLIHNLPTAVATLAGTGSRLEEMYLLTSHSKFYVGINDVGIAPCVCGKSNFYRRSDLDKATDSEFGRGLEKFALYISEDHLIAEALWKQGGRTLVVNQPVVQPLGASSFSVYVQRRLRWLRVRKYMVMVATLVEPTTESILSGIIGASSWAHMHGRRFSWTFFVLHMVLWCIVDYTNFHNILAFKQIGEERATFTEPYYSCSGTNGKRPLKEWLPVWLARELTCLPIWIIAMSGSRIEWRERPFVIRRDLVAQELS